MQTEALRRENDALKRENDALREGVLPPVAPRRRTAVVLGAVAGMFSVGVTLALFVARAPAPPSMPAVSAREVPDDAQIDRAFDAIRPSLAACATGLHHTVTIEAAFDVSGAVTEARAIAPSDRSETGQCVANIVRNARVAPFAHGPFVVRRAFVL